MGSLSFSLPTCFAVLPVTKAIMHSTGPPSLSPWSERAKRQRRCRAIFRTGRRRRRWRRATMHASLRTQAHTHERAGV